MSIPLHQDTSRYISCTFRFFAPQRFAQLRCSEWAPHYRACSRGHRGDDGFLWGHRGDGHGSTWVNLGNMTRMMDGWPLWNFMDHLDIKIYQDPLRSMILWSPTCGHGSWENSWENWWSSTGIGRSSFIFVVTSPPKSRNGPCSSHPSWQWRSLTSSKNQDFGLTLSTGLGRTVTCGFLKWGTSKSSKMRHSQRGNHGFLYFFCGIL